MKHHPLKVSDSALLFELIEDTLSYLQNSTNGKNEIATLEEWHFFESFKEQKHLSEQDLLEKVEPIAKPVEIPLTEKTTSLLSPSQPSIKQTPRAMTPQKALQQPIVTPQKTEKEIKIKTILQKIMPSFLLHDTLLKESKENEYDVLILLCDPSFETMSLVKSLANAINQRLGKVKVLSAFKIEQEKRWKDVLSFPYRLMIATDQFIQLAEAKQTFSEHKKIEKILLEPALNYRDKEKKQMLWKHLCQILSK